MPLDAHGTEYGFDSISGYVVGACAFLAYRREPESLVDPRRMESWLIEPTDQLSPQGERWVRLELGIDGFLTSAWRSPRGMIYATELGGRLFVGQEDDSGGRRWARIEFGDDVELHTVWGLDDRDIYLLGRNTSGPLMWALRQSRFEPMPAPPGRATILRGLGPDLLYAAGDRGLLAQWRGSRWERIRLPLQRNVTGLSVTGADDLWLTSDNGKLFEGTSHGWALRARFDGPLYDVAVWRDRVWLAGGARGLLRLIPRKDRLEVAHRDVHAIALDARGDLLALASDHLASSTDGSSFGACCRHMLHSTRTSHPPRWRAHA